METGLTQVLLNALAEKQGVMEDPCCHGKLKKEQLPTIFCTFKAWHRAHMSPRSRIFTEIPAFSKPDGEH